MLSRLTSFVTRAPRVVLASSALACVLFGAIGSLAADRLSAGGYINPAAESAQADRILSSDFGMSSMQLIFAVESLKALMLNALSLTATFGATVWIFQDGHLGGLGTTTTGYTGPSVPVLMFCIAFGLSMDYEVFLLARFTEEWEKSGRTRVDNDTAVAVGLARSGRVVTAAAVLMAVVFAGFATSSVSLIRMLGLGLVLAVLVDATLVRMILVPAFMRVAGTWNWWAPLPSRPLLEKVRARE